MVIIEYIPNDDETLSRSISGMSSKGMMIGSICLNNQADDINFTRTIAASEINSTLIKCWL